MQASTSSDAEIQQFERRFTESVRERKSRIAEIEETLKSYDDLESNVLSTITDTISKPCMVPLGDLAFMPGEIYHTNEVLVLLGDNYFVKRSVKQARDILMRRKALQTELLEREKRLLHNIYVKVGLVSNMDSLKQKIYEENGGVVDIREEYNEYEEQQREKQQQQQQQRTTKKQQQQKQQQQQQLQQSPEGQQDEIDRLLAELQEREELQGDEEEEDIEEAEQMPIGDSAGSKKSTKSRKKSVGFTDDADQTTHADANYQRMLQRTQYRTQDESEHYLFEEEPDDDSEEEGQTVFRDEADEDGESSDSDAEVEDLEAAFSKYLITNNNRHMKEKQSQQSKTVPVSDIDEVDEILPAAPIKSILKQPKSTTLPNTAAPLQPQPQPPIKMDPKTSGFTGQIIERTATASKAPSQTLSTSSTITTATATAAPAATTATTATTSILQPGVRFSPNIPTATQQETEQQPTKRVSRFKAMRQSGAE